MFDVTVYTDARASEALDGVAGFNFVGASPGADGADRQFITQRMLHVVKSSWHVDHDDELAHPPSCTYRNHNGRYYLSRGSSLGQTITAPRPGNQITQAIVTSAADDFVPYRPAQLYAATQWNLTRGVYGEQLDPWPTPLEIDAAFEADELKADLVDDSPFGSGFLPRFLTMVEQAVGAPAKKLIIVHDDLDVVMRYVALASLFLDSGRALELSFNAFAEQPVAMVADIVGATPAFGVTPAVDASPSAFNVLDVLAGQMTAVDVSGSASRQAAWFTDGDPLDALAAIDLARRWERALGPNVATDAAGIVSFTERLVATPRDRAAALRAVTGLATNGLGDDLAMYADELLDAVVSSPPSTEDDVVVAADAVGAAWSARLDEVAVGILLPTLEVLAARPALITAWAAATGRWYAGRDSLTWQSEESRTHALAAQAQILISARTEDLPDVLVAGKLTGLLPDDRVIAPALDRLTAYWTAHPELSKRRDELPYQPALGARLAARLVGALEIHDPGIVDAFVSGSWDWLKGGSSSLAPWFSVAAVGATRFDERSETIAAQGRQLPVQGWRIALSGAELPQGSAVVAEWLAVHQDIPADLGAWIFQGLKASRSWGEDARAASHVIMTMLNRRTVTRDPDLARLIGDAARITRLYDDAVRAWQDERNAALHDFVVQVTPHISYFGPEVGALLAVVRDRQEIPRLERAAGKHAEPLITEALHAIAERNGDADAVQRALQLHGSGSDVQRAGGLDYLLELMDSRAGRQRISDVGEHLSPQLAAALDGLVEDSKKGRLSRNLVRGGKRLFNKER